MYVIYEKSFLKIDFISNFNAVFLDLFLANQLFLPGRRQFLVDSSWSTIKDTYSQTFISAVFSFENNAGQSIECFTRFSNIHQISPFQMLKISSIQSEFIVVKHRRFVVSCDNKAIFPLSPGFSMGSIFFTLKLNMSTL